MAFFVLVGVGGVVAPFSDWARGDLDARTPLLALFAPAAFGFAGFIWFTRVRVQGRNTRGVSLEAVGGSDLGTPHETGVLVPNLKQVGVCFVVILTAFTAIVLLLAVVIALVLSAEFSAGAAVGAVVVVAFLVVVVRAWADVLRRRAVVGWLALAPSGIHYRAPGHDAYVPWEAAQGISLLGETGEYLVVVHGTTTSSSVFRMRRTIHKHVFELNPDLAIVGGFLSVNPALAFHAIGHYLTHPDARAELGGADGLQRVQTGRFEFEGVAGT
jgi:hypothetical protein